MFRLIPVIPAFFLAGMFATSLYSAPPLPTGVTILTQDDLKARAIFSVGDALRGVTSLKVEQDGSRGTRQLLKMRGLSSSNNVLILIDGRPITHEYNSTVDLAQIPLVMVDRIEITRGGAASAYSSEAIAGTVNIVTLRPNRKGIVTDLGTGVGRDGVKNHLGKIAARSHWGDILYAPSLESSGGFMDNEDYQATNHFGNFTRSFNGKGYWGAEYYFHDSRVGVSNGTLVPLEEWNSYVEHISATPSQQRTEESQHAKAFLASPLIMGGTTYATFTQSWRTYKDRVHRGGIAFRDEQSQSSTFDFSWRHPLLEMGLRTQRFKRQLYPDDAHYSFQNGFYAAGNWRAGAFTIAPGARFDHNTVSGDFFAPRFAVIYAPGESFLISATAQRAHRVPNFEELYFSSAVAQNPALNDEKSVNADLGIAWTPSAFFRFKSTAFLINKEDLITPDAAAVWTNRGTEKARGVETEATVRLGSDMERFHTFSISWTEQRSRRETTAFPGDVAAAMSPRTLMTARLEKHMRRAIIVTNEVLYQSEQFELDNRQGLRVPGSYVWNARFSLRILTADLYFSANNITRRRYAETTALAPLPAGGVVSVLSPQPERTFWAGISIRFIN